MSLDTLTNLKRPFNLRSHVSLKKKTPTSTNRSTTNDWSVVLQCPSQPQHSLSLSQMMPPFSVHANLSTLYTNHCVGASVVTDLKEAGYSNHEVCAITGHQHESSLARYDRIDHKGSNVQPQWPTSSTEKKPSVPAPLPWQPVPPRSVLNRRSKSIAFHHWRHSLVGKRSYPVHQLTLNFTKAEGAAPEQQIQCSSSQELTASVRK